MNKGIEILLARMESNPEEFLGDGKWARVVHAVANRNAGVDTLDISTPSWLYWLSDEDVAAFMAGMAKIHADDFTKYVMEALLVEPKKAEAETFPELHNALQQQAMGVAQAKTSLQSRIPYAEGARMFSEGTTTDASTWGSLANVFGFHNK